MQLRLTIRDAAGSSRDVAVSAPVGTSLESILGALGQPTDPSGVTPPGAGSASAGSASVTLARVTPAGATEWSSGGRRLPVYALLGGPGLRSGDILERSTTRESRPRSPTTARLLVVCGPDAGLSKPLAAGEMTIGRAPDCWLQLRDRNASRRHALLRLSAEGASVRDLGSTNGTSIDGLGTTTGGSPIEAGQYLHLGDSVLTLEAGQTPRAALRPTVGGALLVNRAPRRTEQSRAAAVHWPSDANASPPGRLQWLAALLPAVAGGLLAWVMHNVEFLAFALLSPIIMLATSFGDRVSWHRMRKRSSVERRDLEQRAAREQSQLLADERLARRTAHPDPATLMGTATTPSSRLWERRRTDADFLDLRLGLGTLASRLLAQRGPVTAPAGDLVDVPVHVTLADGPIGVTGPRDMTQSVARWLVAQLTTLHSPADVRLVPLVSADCAADWTWTRWLPHLHNPITDLTDGLRTSVIDLCRLLDERSAGGSRMPAGRWTGPWTVLLLDRAGALADLPGLARLLGAGAAHGISAICLDEEHRRLPSSCVVVASVSGDTGSRLDLESRSGTSPPEILADRLDVELADILARSLAPLVDAGAELDAAIPTSCRLLDLLGLSELNPSAFTARWATGGQARTPIGVGADGVLELDLDRDGPHTLVAGTTGSGKSELLQSLVAGLAAGNSPEDISFVLIDYKGGAAFADCSRLPHAAGLVTDLDSHLTERALRSLDAELRRRESLLAAAGCRDLREYRAQPRDRPLARLVLVVDEFAALVEELPQFVAGLVGVAQRGRSLGVHLVLATQRPGGVISPEIRANTTLRIALRVTDPGESSDVIGSGVAAQIDKATPGRAAIRIGSTVHEIQTARIAATSKTGADRITVLPLDEWGRRPPQPDSLDGRTDLALLVDAMRETAASGGFRPVDRPWLPPLPPRVAQRELAADDSPLRIPIGLVDLPNEQRQQTLTMDLDAAAPVLITGAPGSGRTTVLRTLALGAAQRMSPSELQIYAVDCAGGGLGRLAELAHCHATLTREHPSAIARLLSRLSDEVGRRRAILTACGAGSAREARAHGHTLAALLLLIDGWEEFSATSDDFNSGQLVDDLLALLRESSSVGLNVVVAGGRATLATRLGASFADKYLLRLADRADYGLAGLAIRSIPTALSVCRAVRAHDGYEVQFAHVGSGSETSAQWAALADAIDQPSRTPAVVDTRPIEVKALPSRIELTQLQPAASGATVLGLGGDACQPVTVDLFAGEGRWLVAGPARSGRTTMLRSLLLQAMRHQVNVLVAASRRSPILATAQALGAPVITAGSAAMAEHAATGRLLVLVDDSEAFLDSPTGDELARLARAAGDGQLAVVAAARADELALTYRGVAAEARRSRCGVLLQPAAGDGNLLGTRLPRRQTTSTPGRGVLVCDQLDIDTLAPGATTLDIQIAQP